MTKEEIIQKVKELGLPRGTYVVFGSCPMAVAGIRQADDIDMLVSEEVLATLKKAGWKAVDKGPNDQPLAQDVFEVHTKWNFSSYKPTLEHLLSTSTKVDGVPIASLHEVRKWKQASGRPKDLTDIMLIDDYLRGKTFQTVYIVSGPLGVGKSTVSKELVKTLDNTVLIEGDEFFNATEQSELSWEERLSDAWQKILSQTKDYLNEGLDVVIDFVVESELEWFIEQLSQNKPTIKYVVLIADKKTIIERLKQRNELQYKDRSFQLLEQLSNDLMNSRYLYNTSNRSVPKIVEEFTNSTKYIVNNKP